MLLAFFFMACFDVLPENIDSVDDVPTVLKQSFCPEGAELKVESTQQYCQDTVSTKKNGPSLESNAEGRIFRYFNMGEESIIPWFINTQEQQNLDKVNTYLQQELNITQMRDGHNRFPENRDLLARLIASGERPAGHLSLFPNQSVKKCTTAPKDMLCIESGEWVQRIFNSKGSSYRAFWLERFYIDRERVTQEEVEACQAECKCPRGAWNDWVVAQAYCEQQGKYLPSENHLWMFYSQHGQSLTSGEERFEWSADRFISSGTPYSVQWNTIRNCEGACQDYVAVSTFQRRSAKPSQPYFRCMVTDIADLDPYKKPYLLKTLPAFPPVTQKWRASWSYRNPKTMQEKIKIGNITRYLSPEMANRILWEYKQNYPDRVSVYQIGKTNRGLPLIAVKVSSGTPSQPSILIEGGHHGNELLSILYAFSALDTVLAHPEMSDAFDFWFVPIVNPDGVETKLFRDSTRMYGRKNARNTHGTCELEITEGVDLNRNYPFKWNSSDNRGSKGNSESAYYRGPKAASELETQAIMRLAHEEHFVASLSFHTKGTSILVPYTASRTKAPEPKVAWKVAENIAQVAGTQHNNATFSVRNRRYYAEGTVQDWLMHEFGTLSLHIEGVYHNPNEPAKIKGALAPVSRMVKRLVKDLETLPTLYGHVKDERGQPISAHITVRGQSLKEGEKWFSRARDGYFHRTLLDDGSYEVHFRADGFETLRTNCTVSLDKKVNVVNHIKY